MLIRLPKKTFLFDRLPSAGLNPAEGGTIFCFGVRVAHTGAVIHFSEHSLQPFPLVRIFAEVADNPAVLHKG